ncbi:MAG: aminoacyl-histidine dipeptidase [Oscillospiraceae bacterium]|nr:aminoacyl-histidine dipeptidase [Oscillospiraceae bacterium]
MNLDELEPKQVFRFFRELSAVPRGSGSTAAAAELCLRFARERGLEHYTDSVGNVIIIKPASAGYESAPPVILQGHLDMVCCKASDCQKDMTAEGLDLATDGAFVWAEGTSLGGDDGIAVAMALAALDDGALPHPRLEAFFTTDEETGMTGARCADVSPLRGRRLINIDSEAEGVFTVGCAGGVRAVCSLPAALTKARSDAFEVSVGGLRGGHSGTDIDKGRANANIILGCALESVLQVSGAGLCTLSGGTADNAIPSAASARIVCPRESRGELAERMEKLNAELRLEFAKTDPDVRAELRGVTLGAPDVLDGESARRVVSFLTRCPNGIQSMNSHIPDLVESSLNLGIAELDGSSARFTFSLRSGLPSEMERMKRQLTELTEALGGSIAYSGEYPAWQYREVSPLRELMTEVFTEQYGHAPRVETIHAGLECGLLGEKLPELDCVSIGPDLLDIHSCRERMDVASVQRVWRFLLEVLRRSK